MTGKKFPPEEAFGEFFWGYNSMIGRRLPCASPFLDWFWLFLSSNVDSSAFGVNHSRGKHRWRKGTHVEKYARRFTQLGSSFPHSIWLKAPEKWLQFLCIRWYLSPLNSFPNSSNILSTSEDRKSVNPRRTDVWNYQCKSSILSVNNEKFEKVWKLHWFEED